MCSKQKPKGMNPESWDACLGQNNLFCWKQQPLVPQPNRRWQTPWKKVVICALNENFLQQSLLKEVLVLENNNKRQPLIFILKQINYIVPGVVVIYLFQWMSWEAWERCWTSQQAGFWIVFINWFVSAQGPFKAQMWKCQGEHSAFFT